MFVFINTYFTKHLHLLRVGLYNHTLAKTLSQSEYTGFKRHMFIQVFLNT